MVTKQRWSGWSIVALLIATPVLVVASLLMAGGGCRLLHDPTLIHTDEFKPLQCAPRSFDFGEVISGSEREVTFRVWNESWWRDMANLEDKFPDSKVKIVGFAAGECSPDEQSFRVVSPFPVYLEKDDTVELTLRFAPRVEGSHNCSLAEEVEVVQEPYPTAYYDLIKGCRLTASGFGLPGPEPSCAVDPSNALVDFGEVEVGSEVWQPLTISNQTPDPIPSNQFFYVFDNPTDDCAFFSVDPPADSSGVIGPSGTKQVVVRFAPESGGPLQCVRSLSTLVEPGGSEIGNPCPSEVRWAGAGVVGAPAWASCTPSGFSADLHAVAGLSASELYVAGDGGAVLTPVPGSVCEWQSAGTGFTDVDLRDLWVHEEGSEMALWAVGNIPPPEGLYQETGAILFAPAPDQASWTQIDEDGLQTFEAVWGSGFDDVYFAGLGVSTDFPNAKHFTGDPENLEEFAISWSGMDEVSALHGTAADDIWAVFRTSWDAVYRFTGGSPTDDWEDMTPPFAPVSPLNDVWVQTGDGFDVVYAVGDDGAIYHYDRAAGAWLDDESIFGQDGDFHGVWVSPTGTVFAVGEGPMIYQGHVNEPGVWTRHTIPAAAVSVGDVLFDVWGTDDENVYAVGTNGVILRYAPEGASSMASR